MDIIKYVNIPDIPNIPLFPPVLINGSTTDSLSITPSVKLMEVLDNLKKELIDAVYQNKKIFGQRSKNNIEELYCNPCKNTPTGNILVLNTKNIPNIAESTNTISGYLVVSGIWVSKKSWGPCIGIENIGIENIGNISSITNFIDSDSEPESEINY